PRLRLLGDVRPKLLRRAVHRAVLLTLPRDELPGGRPALRVGTGRGLVDAAPGRTDPGPARWFPAHLLLLPQGLLPVVLAVAAGLRGERAAPQVHRRDPPPADPAEHPPVLLVRGGVHRRRAQLGRDPRLPR